VALLPHTQRTVTERGGPEIPSLALAMAGADGV